MAIVEAFLASIGIFAVTLAVVYALYRWLGNRHGWLDGGAMGGYGRCRRCGRSWAHGDYHGTDYTERRGCFVLCEGCWARLTPQERLPFYRSWWEEQQRSYPDDARDWSLIEAAVLAGK